MSERIKAIDLCCGAGGWACAARGLPIDVVAAVDLWEPACRTYGLNWRLVKVIQGDLRDTAVRAEVEGIAAQHDVQLILGGIPCEWLSIRRNVGNASSDAERKAERATLAAVLALVLSGIIREWRARESQTDIPAARL